MSNALSETIRKLWRVGAMSGVISAALFFALGTSPTLAQSFTTLDYPPSLSNTGPVRFTEAEGVSVATDGNTYVSGNYGDNSNGLRHSFVYTVDGPNAGTYSTPIDYPSAGTGINQGTEAQGMSGNTLVGYYTDSANTVHGFSYDYIPGGPGASSIDAPPPATGTFLFGTNGSDYVGYSQVGSSSNGFVYNSSADIWGGPGFNPVTVPFSAATQTIAYGISGDGTAGSAKLNVISGTYITGGLPQGFLDIPSSAPQQFHSIDAAMLGLNPTQYPEVVAYGVDGNTLVGWAYGPSASAFGFYATFNSSGMILSAHPLNVPGATGTEPQEIYGNTIVGQYNDASGTHGFVTTVPEPSGVVLLTLGGLALGVRLRRRLP